MHQKFSIFKWVASACLLLMLSPFSASAADSVVLDTAPDRYTVQKGDTLWGIAGKFLKQPWRWPEIWRMNREDVRNPPWIYPGNVIVLDRNADGQLRLQLADERPVVRMSPEIRTEAVGANAIPTIPADDLGPFISRPLVVGENGPEGAAKIVAGRGGRVIRGEGDIIYVLGIDESAGNSWQIYRVGEPLRAWGKPESILGYEARYLGAVVVQRYGDASTLHITSAREEVLIEGLLVPAPKETLLNSVPHAPELAVEDHVIQLANKAVEAGRGSIITIDLGREDTLEVGHVLAIYQAAPRIIDPRAVADPNILDRFGDVTRTLRPPTRFLSIPDERVGLAFVFRTFENVAYALVVSSEEAVRVGDIVRRS